MNRIACIVVFLSCLALPLSAGAQEWPDWLTEAMAAETRKLKSKKYKLGDTGVTVRLAGKNAEKPELTEDDGDWYMSSEIGGNARMECFATNTRLNLAATAAALADLSIENVTEQGLPLAARQIYHVEAGALDGAPFLALEWLYTVGEAPETTAGLAKVRVAQRDGWAYYCLHNDLGYRETFADAFSTLVRGAEGAVLQFPPYFEEVLLQKIDGRTLGIMRTTFVRDDEGDTYTELQSALLLPVDGATLSTMDTLDYDWSRPNGALINAAATSTTDGRQDLDVTLSPENEKWSVLGSVQGKEVSATLGGDITPASTLYQYLVVRDIMTSPDEDETSFHLWAPSISPTEFAPVSVRTTPEDREAGRAVLELGPLELPLVVDDKGLIAETRMDIGGSELKIERVWLRGELD